MDENLKISGHTKAERYETLLPQLKGLIADEPNWVGVLANSAAALRQTMGFFWVGFYLTDTFMARHNIHAHNNCYAATGQGAVDCGEHLLLGPFQGDIACYNIKKGRGVCGTAWQQGKTLVIRDVEDFPGHIACSSLSRSEIVVPITWQGGSTGYAGHRQRQDSSIRRHRQAVSRKSGIHNSTMCCRLLTMGNNIKNIFYTHI